MTWHTNKICCARSQKKHTFLMLSVLCAELLNNPFKSWSFWEETKIHFYCIFFFYKSYMHCILFWVTEWINHTKVPFWIVSTSSLIFISYELLNMKRTEHATFYNLLNSLEYYTDLCLRGLFFVCFFAWKYVWILKNVLPQSFAGFFLLVETACNRLVWMVIVQQSEAVHIGIKYLSSVRTRIITVC